MGRKGSIQILIIILLIALTIFSTIAYLKLKPIPNTQSIPTSQSQIDAERLTINGKLDKYRLMKMKMFTVQTNVQTEWGFWNVNESTLNLLKSKVDQKYETQVINGLKNVSIIVNKVKYINRIKPREAVPIVVFSDRFIGFFADLVKNANMKLNSDSDFSSLPIYEQGAYLLSNPSPNADVLKEQKYSDAFGNVRSYILKQNDDFNKEVINLCNSAKDNFTKNSCFINAAGSLIDDFDCNLIDKDFPNGRESCYESRADANQDINMCNLTGIYQKNCLQWIYGSDYSFMK